MQHSAQQNEPKTTGSDMCLVENRDIENFSNLNSEEVANRVWETCKPTGSFMSKSPTVSARRVQLMRVYLQSYVPDPEPEGPEPCKKSSKTSGRSQRKCPCRKSRKSYSKANSGPSGSMADMVYDCPDENEENDCCEEEDDDEDDDDCKD